MFARSANLKALGHEVVQLDCLNVHLSFSFRFGSSVPHALLAKSGRRQKTGGIRISPAGRGGRERDGIRLGQT